ncbi:MAG: glycosyltransferase, partial [Actinobacteria bacterium]|nr:glycosyltransferase [Actinomycetota bacterium]
MDADDKPTPGTDDHISLASRREAFAELADLNDDPPPDETSSEQGEATAISGEGDDVTIVPPVVAVVVVHNAGEWLDEVLESLGAQTYTNLSILVIDAGSDIDPTPRIAEVLPGAFVRRLEHNSGFGPTVNEILELVSGASFYCLCHDDVALDPDALHELVAEAFRSNAGIVGPKLVDWDDPELLTSVGFTVDRSGGRAPYAEHHELDQGQHDAVRDVFAVSGGCTLIRSDLFDHLGGYDPDIDLVGEDLDLCWRAHLVGARVVVAPRARARHRGDLGARIDPERLPGVDAAHRLRTVLTNSRLVRLVVLVPQLLLTTVVEAVVEAVIGRRSHARAQLGAWGANLRRSGSILRARKRVRAIREGNDRTVRQLQTKIRSRLDGLVQTYRRDRAERILAEAGGHATPGRPSDTSGTGRSALSGGEDDSDGFVRVVAPERTHSLVVWGLVAIIVILVVGTRELFFGAIPPIGTFAAPPPSLGELWRVWVGSWNPAGLGSHQSPAAGVGPLALAGTILGGAFGFIRRVAILGPIILGLVGAWRLPRELGSRRAQLVAFVVYAAVPVPWNALSQGVWSGVLAYGIAPWLLRTAVRAMRVEPFGGDGTHADRPWWVTVAGFAPVLAVAIALVPSIALVGAVVLLGLTIGSALIGRFAGVGRMLLVTGGSLIAAVLLLLPWVIVGPGRSLWTLAGVGGGAHG